MWNISDTNESICERIINTGLHSDMLENLSWESLSASSLDKTESSAKRSFVKAHINILHNVVRRTELSELSREAFRKCQAVDVVQKFRDVTTEPVIVYELLYVTQDNGLRLFSSVAERYIVPQCVCITVLNDKSLYCSAKCCLLFSILAKACNGCFKINFKQSAGKTTLSLVSRK